MAVIYSRAKKPARASVEVGAGKTGNGEPGTGNREPGKAKAKGKGKGKDTKEGKDNA